MSLSVPSNGPPPAFQAINTIELVSTKDSKIISVSVYAGRAEITRLFKFAVKTGQNQLTILGLPAVLDQESLKVEGRGAATIHDVTISSITPPPVPTTSPTLSALLTKQKRAQKALARALKSISSLETYLTSVNSDHLEVAKLKEVVEGYDSTAEELDNKVTELEAEIKETTDAISEEKNQLAGPTENEKLNLKAVIGVFAESEGDIKVALVYAVHNATWKAGYDIRVDMQSKEKPISLIYKASITQSTGEDWDDVPLTLETAAPTFGIGVPVLTPWTLSIAPNYYGSFKSKSISYGRAPPGAAVPAMSSLLSAVPSASLARMSSRDDSSEEGVAEMHHRELQVSSKGAVSATFGVPGLISIPNDGVGHSVTIARLSLDAEMSWVCVPKKDTRVHLKAKIKNASEYTLLSGTASVYVDGSFISKSEVPLVSPDEGFDCPLGLDPSIRVTYHPLNKKTSQSGLYSKTSVHSFSQRITLHNTKPSSSNGSLKIKVIDQVPVSEDSTIGVKLLQPPLVLPSAEGSSSGNGVQRAVKVSPGIVAAWLGTDEETGQDVDADALGKDGKFSWTGSVQPQSQIGLILQYEVSAPLKTKIAGL
ncbi:hypothetical protein BDN70DRAFT_882734 [Pholiota conissans]|uniref:Mucoidy inhibitor A n=1 Tax=Pholiota conissans TaxID=109636 RepID=A0A9P5YVG5_9AGAR|nr:hypothetical protein BDN70DRAFT_882734 [Pholiota conissans]